MKSSPKGISSIAGVHLNVNRGLTALGGVAVLLLCLYTTGDVIGRYLLDNPLPASWELTLILLVVITFWGIGYVQARGRHMRLEFLWQRFGPRGQIILDILSVLIGLFLFAIVTWQVWLWTVDAWVTHEAMLGIWRIPYFPPRLALTIGAFSLCIQYVIDLVRYTGKLLSMGQEAEEK